MKLILVVILALWTSMPVMADLSDGKGVGPSRPVLMEIDGVCHPEVCRQIIKDDDKQAMTSMAFKSCCADPTKGERQENGCCEQTPDAPGCTLVKDFPRSNTKALPDSDDATPQQTNPSSGVRQ